MTADKIREIFLALKLHYSNDKYDYTKFSNRKLRGRVTADTFHYEKFASKFSSETSAELFFASNMMKDFHKTFSFNTFIGDYYNIENFKYLKEWYSYMKNVLPDNYKQYTSLFTVDDLISPGKTLPKVFEDYLKGNISLDILTTFVYNNSNNPEIDIWEVTAQSDPLFEKLYLVVKKHMLMLKYKQLLQ